ncbi:hypothetical protein CW745_15170 [Psychromonas sp. psych-6C06]|uniref:substrate-binding periplasmic protein n=1 Tax=Psychromonas sp. psych-6C06 TaxID=2058089 RepID=UPI000C346AB6|nr:hypothetical protein [Psychromonas sp. psych-6C06]PKF60404.1 hypothetical protein CW745_15170 [Psychromonas sp. psych-6C06]
MKILLGSLLFLLMHNSFANTVNICAEDTENLPYVGIENKGIFNEFMDLISAQGDFNVVLHNLPWKRCLRSVEQGEMDGAFAVIHTQERDLLYAFPKKKNGELDQSKVIWQAEYPIFVHQESDFSWNGVSFNQQKLQLSAPLGYVAYQKLKQLGVLFPSNLSHQKGLGLVARKRIDGYVVERAIGETLLRKKGIVKNMKQLPIPFLTSSWYLVLSHRYTKNYADEAITFWNTLAKVRDEHGQRLYKQQMQ